MERISLWRYIENERNYPGWHLNADVAGCQLLLSLLQALAGDGIGTRTVAISAPTPKQLGVPNNRSGTAAWVSPTKLRLGLSATAGEWTFPGDLDPAVLSVGADWLPRLREGIAGIPQGRGDYSIGDRKAGNLPLWFWW